MAGRTDRQGRAGRALVYSASFSHLVALMGGCAAADRK